MIACVANKKAVFGCHFIYIYIYIYVYISLYIHINCTKHCIDICVHFGHLFSFSITYINFIVRSSVFRCLVPLQLYKRVNSLTLRIIRPSWHSAAPNELFLITSFFDCSRIDSWLFTLNILHLSEPWSIVTYRFVGIPRQSPSNVRSSRRGGHPKRGIRENSLAQHYIACWLIYHFVARI